MIKTNTDMGKREKMGMLKEIKRMKTTETTVIQKTKQNYQFLKA